MLLRPDPLPGRRPIALQPHQQQLREHLPQMRYPFYIFWGMGSGKTIAGCVAMEALGDGENALVLCDKSTVEQWNAEVRRVLGCNTARYAAKMGVRVAHYEALDQRDGPTPGRFALVVVDEAHRFRNAWPDSERMQRWMAAIKACARVVFLSGTPIVHDAVKETAALRQMMGDDDWTGRVSCYDPRADAANAKHYARVEEEVVECPMSWAQCFRYLLHRRQRFTIQLEEDEAPRTRVSSTRNSYNTQLRSISNCPFPDLPDSSPKVRAIVAKLREWQAERQVVYSCRRDTGVDALRAAWTGKKVYSINGSMSTAERAAQLQQFNRCYAAVLFLTDAGAQGLDLKRVTVVHIMEPADNLQDERQVINRAVRYKAHRSFADARVRVLRYISVFPTEGRVEAPWKRELHDSGLFDAHELRGCTRRVQYALLRLIAEEEHGATVDQRTLVARAAREIQVQAALETLRAASV